MRCASEIRFTCHFPDTHPKDPKAFRDKMREQGRAQGKGKGKGRGKGNKGQPKAE